MPIFPSSSFIVAAYRARVVRDLMDLTLAVFLGVVLPLAVALILWWLS